MHVLKCSPIIWITLIRPTHPGDPWSPYIQSLWSIYPWSPCVYKTHPPRRPMKSIHPVFGVNLSTKSMCLCIHKVHISIRAMRFLWSLGFLHPCIIILVHVIHEILMSRHPWDPWCQDIHEILDVQISMRSLRSRHPWRPWVFWVDKACRCCLQYM